MKTLLKCIVSTALLATLSFCDNIDGTLAVDNYNQQSNDGGFTAEYKPESNSVDVSSKGSEEPVTTTPVGAYAGSTFLEGPFVGVELGYLLSADADGRDTSGSTYGLRFGAQNLEWRTMAILQKYSNSDGANDYLKGEVDLDYFFLGTDNLVVDSYALRPYFGLNVGAMSMETEYNNVTTMTYGAQIGTTMNLTNQLDLDVSYKYNLATSDSVNSVSGITAGIHYKY